jgi:hypothetical protein
MINGIKKRGLIAVKIEEGETVYKTANEISVLYPDTMIEIVDEGEAMFCACCLGGVVEFKIFARGRKHRVGWCNKCEAGMMVDEISNAICVQQERGGHYKYLCKENYDKKPVAF